MHVSIEYYAVPPPNLTCYINDELYETVNNTTSYGIHNIVFTNTSEGGQYRCEVMNEFGRDEYIVFVEINGNTLSDLCTAVLIHLCIL